jgi:oligopeptide transport system permease protein
MLVVLAFLLLILASGLGLVAADWQREAACPTRRPRFVGPAGRGQTGAIAQPKGPNVDLSDIDPLAPRYKPSGPSAPPVPDRRAVKAETLPLGGDRLGRDVLAKAIKGTEISVFVGVLAASSPR